MLGKLRDRLTYANVMATIAVFAAVGGGAFAVGAIPDGEGKINACYVPSGKKKGHVRLVTKAKCRRGERHVAWNQRGESGATNVVVRQERFLCRSGSCTSIHFGVSCQPGERATGGGARVLSDGDRLTASQPRFASGTETPTPTGWEVSIHDGSGVGAISGEAYVVCASP